MAKKEAKVQKYQYPSRFGSHKSMVIREDGDNVICQDEYGEYSTSRSMLDNGMSDPNRNCESRLSKLFQRSQKDKA